ncbi:tripartite tricarboxylate transporter TctB family protein [Pelagibacteraceae bacterium]|jgi:putative tricarboxylic transport membrane protein|nr:tripartite tricarboxylate transporter TctB family protein [Pelagibacteraceae bacterium]MDC1256242.1 tripartite tricarboxylate transporter TctB family protein [Pelagibacteraceae bacterium]MDC1539026.1 tripartite tricarboxylate transporter TctB family protein [Pelagibacteraceae bacterium]
MSDKKLNPASKYTLGAGLIHKVDLIVASIIIIGGGFMYYEATLFPAAPNILGDTLNADVFPKMLIVIMIILASIIPFEISFMPEKIAKIDKGRSVSLEPITWKTIVLLIALVSVAEFLGPAVTMFVTAVSFPLVWGEKNYLRIAIYSVAFPIFVYLVFNKVLGLFFDPGVLKYLN